MAACVSCGQRKGKRSCPALGGLICPKCCGTKRVVEIHCPPDCRYLSHERYQGEKILGAASPLQQRYLEASRSGRAHFETMIFVDLCLADHLRAHPDTPPAAVREGVRFLRRLASPLETIEGVTGLLEQRLEATLRPLLERGSLDRDLLVAVAEEDLAFFEEHLENEEEIRSYLRFVDAFAGDAPRPRPPEDEAPDDGSEEGDGDEGVGLIVPG